MSERQLSTRCRPSSLEKMMEVICNVMLYKNGYKVMNVTVKYMNVNGRN